MQKFLARQPIFNSDRIVYGYEILFRSGPENYFSHLQPDIASVSAADNLFLIGVDRLTQGRRAFINCTREFLVRDYPTLLPKESIVVEVLENILLDEHVISACQRLKQAGYLIALDDFQDLEEWSKLVELADFIKVDLLATAPDEQLRLARKFSGKVPLIAEKVETYEDFQRTAKWGYSYFQGYFFSHPQILSHHAVPAYKLSYLRILQAANKPQMDLDEIARQIKSEPSLSYRLLRYLNSPAFFLMTEVRSIEHSLTLLGERGIRKWVSLVAVACMGEEKPEELLVLPLIRGRFCELLAPNVGLADSSNDLFLLGLLSAMDAILDMPMEDVLHEVTVRPEIRDALLGKKNPLRDIFDIALFYEAGAWDAIDASAARLGISSEVIPGFFLNAMDWAKQLMAGKTPTEVDAD